MTASGVPLTRVELCYEAGKLERWIRFGAAVESRQIDARNRAVFFAAGTVFGFVRWASNDYGTVLSRFDIARAPGPGEACMSLPYVTPGAVSLLRLKGWPKVSQALDAITAIEALGIDPQDVCPDHWRHMHHRLTAGLTPRTYTAERHAAWLKRKALAP